ncbi:MAG: YhfC family intramembrane metalloprotease [Chloroflexi bacterium]|nr:YhfC family intramembrane metalloprotease [Chloroflexota bacterium]
MIAFWFYYLSAFLMVAMPLVAGWWIHRKRRASWGLYLIGMVTFIGSQVLHIPFNWLVLQRWELLPTDTAVLANLIILALFLGLSAGVFEEGARYLTYRFWARDARTWGTGLMLGAGHGGIESILVGASVGANAIVLGAMSQGQLPSMVPADQMGLVQTQITAMLDAPFALVMMGALERLFAITAHLAMSLLVMQAFVRRQIGWLGLSILWHTLLNFVAVVAVVTWNVYITEALIGVMALLSLGIIFWLRTPEPVEPELEPLPPPAPIQPHAGPFSDDTLEKSRYT